MRTENNGFPNLRGGPDGAGLSKSKEAPMVKLRPIWGRHHVPAKLLKVERSKAYVLPKGHKRLVIVPVTRVALWKSRNRRNVRAWEEAKNFVSNLIAEAKKTTASEVEQEVET